MTHTLEKVVGGSRAAVLRALEGRMRAVTEIVEETGLSQPNVSNHLARLREQGLVMPHREGKRIYYALTDPDLVRALLTVPMAIALPPEQHARAVEDLAEGFEAAVLSGDHEGARGLIDQALAQSLPWQELYTRVFGPLLVKIGAQWEEGRLSVSEEHAASYLVERMMSHVATLRIPAPRDGRCEVVVACVEGELHHIGSRMLADFLAAAGWSVVYLGANVPNESLESYVRRHHPSVVALSAATVQREEAVRDAAARIRTLGNGVPAPRLLAGGRLFLLRPDLAAEIGAEALPPTPEAAVDLLSSHRRSR